MALKDRQHQSEDTGRKGYREAHEYPDDRPCINHSQFWQGDEQAAYEAAVRANPIREDDNLDSYLSRIVAVVEGRPAGPVHSMPAVRPSPSEYKQRVMKLERQREPGDDFEDV